MTQHLLVAGLPGAGKSTLAERIANAGIGFTHISLDRYIRAVPARMTFLEWVRTPNCVDWDLLYAHIQLLCQGNVCYTPRPDWSRGGQRISAGGLEPNELGLRMEPAHRGYIIPGTHAFSFVAHSDQSARLFVDTPDEVIVSRLENRSVDKPALASVLSTHLGNNDAPLRALRAKADLVVAGTLSNTEQVRAIEAFLDGTNGSS